jgi:dynein heavy chain
MMDLLLLTMAQSCSGGGATPEQTVGQVADDILRRMPKPWNLAKVQSKYPTQYTESMNTVLLQELTRFNKLIEIVLSTLKDIQKAIKGLLLMSQQLEGAFLQMYDGKTPGMWLAKSYPSLKPLGSYVSDLVERLKFFQTWVDDGIPVLFWMSGIYFTQAFTTGAAQNYARKYTIPIDTLSFDFEFPKEQDPKEKPQDGVFTYGSFLEGCKWDWEKWELSESDPKVLYVSVPLVWIVPCKKTEVKETPHYTCPMYKVSSRKGTLSTTGHSTNFVMFINTPSSIPETHWTKRGVAMLTQLDT